MENFPASCSVDSDCVDGDVTFHLLQLPEEILLHVLSFMSYHNISEIRRCCQTFNRMCQHLLTQGFAKVDRFHGAIQRKVKSQLPRRESERRNHSLARHVDILSAIETRLSLLNMTYMKYIDVGLCSFIPGKVLDELFRILRVLQDCPEPPRAHEFLQELRDISSMAMEHFEEKIVPLVKQKIPALNMPAPFSESLEMPPGPGSRAFTDLQFSMASSARQDISKLHHQIRSHGMTLRTCRKEITVLRLKVTEQRKLIMEQEKKNSDQGRIISEQNSRLHEQDKKISDFSRKILEYDQKFSDIFSEISKTSGSFTSPESARESLTKTAPSSSCTDTKRDLSPEHSDGGRKRLRSQPNAKGKKSTVKRRKT